MSITLNQAIRIAEERANRNYDGTDTGPILVIRELTIEKPYGWWFILNSEKYILTKERLYNVFGLNLILVENRNGEVSVSYESGRLVNEIIEEFEKNRADETR